MMSDRAPELNFYAMWLGIECRSRPNHYQLLGLAPFESDERKILAAFDARRRQLQGISPGEFSTQWRKLADEVISAKRCLVTPAARLVYDEHLRYTAQQNGSRDRSEELNPAAGTPSSTTSASRASPPVRVSSVPRQNDESFDDLPELPPEAGNAGHFIPVQRPSPNDRGARPTPVDPLPVGVAATNLLASGPRIAVSTSAGQRSSIALGKATRRRRHRHRNLVMLLVIVTVSIAAGLILLMQQPNRLTQVAQSPSNSPSVASNQSSVAPQAGAAGDVEPERLRPNQRSLDSQLPKAKPSVGRPEGLPPQAAPAEPNSTKTAAGGAPKVDAEQEMALKLVFTSLRDILALRRFEEAATIIEAAEQVVISDEQKRQIDLHRQLVRHATGFWDAVGSGAAKLQAGDELEHNGKIFAVVVDSRPGKLTIRAEGKNQTYTIPDGIDAKLAVAIAEKTIADKVELNRLLGAFHATDAQGDRSKARQLWESAGEEMQPLVKLLMTDSSNVR